MSIYNDAAASGHDLPDWSPRWWLFYVIVPLLLLLGVLAVAHAGGAVNYWVLQSQVGVAETATGGMALVAGAIALVAFFQPTIRNDWTVRGWLLAFVAAMIYYAGEDMNWGQYYFGWSAPEYFLQNNREQETNLHNMSSWFNQKPRLFVELWLAIACIAVPLGWQLPQRLTAKLVPRPFWPDTRLVFIAALALAMLAIDFLAKRGYAPYTLRWSEVEEIFFTYGWLVYAAMLLTRIRDRQDEAAA